VQQASALSALLGRGGIAVDEKAILGLVDPAALKSLGGGLLSGLTTAFSSIVLILLTVSFILLEASSFPVKLRAATHRPGAVFPEFAKFINDIKRYVVTQTAVSLTRV
jgi:predicted PurR-regulated permease PerM